MIDCHAIGVRSYIAEPDRGRRDWSEAPDAQRRVYANRRRIRGTRGRRLMRRRGEYVERTFAHTYDTGGMRRTHLRGHQNILKRLIVHAAGFNLGLLMRSLVGVGKPRRLQGAAAAVIVAGWDAVRRRTGSVIAVVGQIHVWLAPITIISTLSLGRQRFAAEATLTTGC